MNDSSDKLFSARLSDMVSTCERNGTAAFSNFLDERQCAVAEQWCRNNAGECRYMLWGGFPEARRKILAVYPYYLEEYIKEDFPLVCLTFTFRKEDKLTHRDFLGTFMGMMLKREVIGDIVVTEGKAQAFVTEVAAKLIMCTLAKIGRFGVKVSDDVPFELDTVQEYQKISGTVASMRLDCIVSLAAHISREKAADLIKAEKVDVNHFTIPSQSHEVHEGDVISIRGSGRYVVSAVNGVTSKGRIHTDLLKYI